MIPSRRWTKLMRNMEKTKDLGFETFRASIDIINEEERSFTCIAASDKAILLQGYKYSEKSETFTEKLSFEEGAVDPTMLEIGLPLFPSHWDRKSTDQLGITTEYVLSDNSLEVTIKLGARADDVLWTDIKNKVTKTVSLGFDILKVQRTIESDRPEYTVLYWKPKHVALAPEPADSNCTVRSSAQVIGGVEITPEPIQIEEKDILKKLFTK